MATKAELEKQLAEMRAYAAEMQRQRDEAVGVSRGEISPKADNYSQYYAENLAQKDVEIARLKGILHTFSEKDIPKMDQDALAAENRKLSRQLEAEKARSASYRKTIRFLEKMVDGEDGATYEENPDIPVIGRPRSGDKKTDAMARKLRREGYSIREIAARTGYNVQKAHEVTKSVKITDEIKEKQKIHRAENRKQARK